ncbi:hypothetical protein BDA99DRAFT_513852 [Phascolomyces articulosus]|uniref:Uncharacterized protein n=1 Tax=Phascolomyces articulosus TaxID=60185 RepID=A0AAD5PEL4_9FUNG|nr:hypothetical protein BDA99DRAFT_513852 [Phascolomyces articulosus]
MTDVDVNSTSLVVEWSRAVQQVDLYRIQQLIDIHRDLLWEPLTWDPDRDASHVIHQLMIVQNLGTSLDNLCAIPYTLLQYFEPSPGEVPSEAQVQTENLLHFLIDQSSIHDLNNRVWGNCNNTTLHLVSFLGHVQIAQRLIKEKGASINIPNDLGCLPRDVAQTSTMASLLGSGSRSTTSSKQQQSREKKVQIKTKPNYASADRFKQLKQLAEATNNSKNANSNHSTTRQEGRFFRAGHVAESKMKVLNDEEAELEKQRAKRRQEVAQLAKRSAVKSNPLFRKFEQRQGISKPRRSFVVKNQQEQQIKSNDVAITMSGDMHRSTSVDTNHTESSIEEQPHRDEEEMEELGGEEVVSKPKRNSKVISSLRKNTYVSSSVFRQGEEPSTPSVRNSIIKPSPSVSSSSSMGRTNSDDTTSSGITTAVQQNNTIVDIQVQDIHASEQDTISEQPTSPIQDRRSLIINEIHVAQEPDAAENLDRRRLSGSQKAHWSIALNSWSSVLDSTVERVDESVASEDSGADDEDDDLEWFDSQEDHIEHIRKKKSKASLKSVSSNKTSNESSSSTPLSPQTTTTTTTTTTKEYYLGSLPDIPTTSSPTEVEHAPHFTTATTNSKPFFVEDDDPYSHYSTTTRQDDVNTTVRIISRSRTNTDASSSPSVMTDHSSTSTTSSSSSSSSPATMSPSSPITLPPLASIPEKNMNSLFDNSSTSTNTNDNHQNDINYGSVSVQSTSRYARRLSHAQNAYRMQERKDHETTAPLLNCNIPSQQFKIKRVPVKLPPASSTSSSSSSLFAQQESELNNHIKKKNNDHIKKLPSLQDLQSSLPPVMNPNMRRQHSSSRHGKLYFRVTGISNVLLPLPREPTYVRLVVSDDRYEYMSRYEMLGQHIKFDYECIMDTYPEMIITISLHVRPDYHVRNKVPLTRLFSTSRSRARQGSLSSYIYQEDGSLGRARFALPHMMESCYERPYATQFDCFNAWSARDKAKHHHREDDDSLKVIGNLDVEMLYLPISDPTATIPRNLRDCDMAIKVQQWNEAFWNTEQLSNTTISSSNTNVSSHYANTTATNS